ncbi:MAG: homoserine O-acetyltransferase [Planctomycetaceae bacterium]|nr:homoserine O-acetyltransferase [Planctomycetaceae bacterium]
MTESFQSSDSIRGVGPLRHARRAVFDQPLTLERGGRLEQIEVVYETYGRLNAAADNAVWICHALSGDSHVARHDEGDDAGWWDLAGFVGPGCPIDTDRYFVICPNILGGCRGTTGPGSLNPATGKPYGPAFPTITIGDMVEVNRRLMNHLGIRKLLAVIGGSMGGHQVLQWAARYGDEMAGVIPLASSARLSSQALAFDVVARNAILRDPHFFGGEYYDKIAGPSVGLAIARMIGHITYLSREAMQEKFESDRLAPRDVAIEFEKEFSVGTYLGYQGSKFVERFDANSYIALSMAMDLFDLGATPERLAEVFRRSSARWLVVSFSSDWLFSPAESQHIVNALIKAQRAVSYCNVASTCGHDAFLLDNEVRVYGELVRAFLGDLSGDAHDDGPGDADDAGGISHTNIFSPSRPQRLDYSLIASLIEPGASVLDLGCGSGGLLTQLRLRGHQVLHGIEIDEQEIIACVRRGLSVMHADLNNGLRSFGDGQFDCVVLSQTLQAIKDVEQVVADMLRVGRRCVVSFPNFGYRKLREMLYHEGRAPRSEGLLRYTWYNTPNIRFLTLDDFEAFCSDKGITIHRRVALDTEKAKEITLDPNRNADLAIFVLSR